MNYKVEDLSSLSHADDLMSGFVNPDSITYGANGRNNSSKKEQTSSAEGDVVNPELVNAGINLAGEIIGLASGARKTELERAIKASCGRRPRIGKERKESYRTCASGVLQSSSGITSGDDRSSNNNRDNFDRNSNDDRQNQGISTGAVVGIILGVAVVGTVIVLAVKHAQKAK